MAFISIATAVSASADDGRISSADSRPNLAWTVFAISGLGVLSLVGWSMAFRQRRENAQLKQLVESRTEAQAPTPSAQKIGESAETASEPTPTAGQPRELPHSADIEPRPQEGIPQESLQPRQRSTGELDQPESLSSLILNRAPVGIFWKRSDRDDVCHVNPSFRRILGLPLDAPADETLLEKFVHPDDAAHQVLMNRAIASGESDSYEIEQRLVLGDGSLVWTSLSVAVVRDPQGRIVQSMGILEDITPREQAIHELATARKNLTETSRMAGMAEMATGVLHNIGNVLNSVNVSANLIANGIRQSKVESLVKLSALFEERAANLAEFLTENPKGKLVPEMLSKLAQHSVAERDWLVKEVASMQKNIDHIQDIVTMQQSYATVLGVVEILEPYTLFEDALRMNTAALMRHDVTVLREYLPSPQISVEKGKVLQILVNLIRNAKYACDDMQEAPEGTRKLMTVRVEPTPDGKVRLIVRDNGIGIAPENITRIFEHGFTTRAYGHGFGLHASAQAAREMQGSLTAVSEGLGKGTTFVLEVPMARPSTVANRS